MGEDVAGVRRPIPVVPGVQVPRRPVDRDLHPHRAAHAERELRPAALVRGTIEEQPDVDVVDPVPSHLHVGAEVRGAGLLLAIEEEDQVGRGRDAGLGERAKDREDGCDGRLVVTGRAGVDAPLGIDFLTGRRKGSRLTTGLHRRRVQRGLEGRVGPVGGVDGLPVVVDVDPQRPGGARDPELAVDDGRYAIHLQELGGDPDVDQLVANVLGGPPNVVQVGGPIGIGQELGEVVEDRGLVGLAVCAGDVGA